MGELTQGSKSTFVLTEDTGSIPSTVFMAQTHLYPQSPGIQLSLPTSTATRDTFGIQKYMPLES